MCVCVRVCLSVRVCCLYDETQRVRTGYNCIQPQKEHQGKKKIKIKFCFLNRNKKENLTQQRNRFFFHQQNRIGRSNVKVIARIKH